ncbi:MAG: hypothetical protein ABSH20_07335 [Tepidisphaeraceae bacterium]
MKGQTPAVKWSLPSATTGPPRTAQVSIIRPFPSTGRERGAVLRFQSRFPVWTPRAYTQPSSDPTKTRPSAAAGAVRIGPWANKRQTSQPSKVRYAVTESSSDDTMIRWPRETIGR